LPVGSRAISCGCASELACATNAACINDITKWYNWIGANVGQTRVIVVGVGDNTTICPSQLLLAAGGDPTNVYNPKSWNDLQTLVQTISATACTVTAQGCGTSCCGLCNCGVCIPVPACRSVGKCTIGTFDNSTQCCRSDDLILFPVYLFLVKLPLAMT